jgi:hypothetical protein
MEYIIGILVSSKKSKRSHNLSTDGLIASVILATWEAEIRRITVQGQANQKFERPPSPK